MLINVGDRVLFWQYSFHLERDLEEIGTVMELGPSVKLKGIHREFEVDASKIIAVVDLSCEKVKIGTHRGRFRILLGALEQSA